MKHKKLWLSILLCIVIFIGFYTVLVLDITQLIRINQVLGIEPNWSSFHEYLTRELPGMLRGDVHSLFERIGMRAVIHSQDDCEYVRLGNLLKIMSYSFCYDKTDQLIVLNLSS